jgi:hypothetical protein
MRDFKFFNKRPELLFVNNALTLQPHVFENVEFCYQFDDDEPVVFADGTNELRITVNDTSGGNITFTDNNKNFTIFARERQ